MNTILENGKYFVVSDYADDLVRKMAVLTEIGGLVWEPCGACMDAGFFKAPYGEKAELLARISADDGTVAVTGLEVRLLYSDEESCYCIRPPYKPMARKLAHFIVSSFKSKCHADNHYPCMSLTKFRRRLANSIACRQNACAERDAIEGDLP